MQRNSKQRELIYDCIRFTKSHPSAEWIYNKLKDEYPTLGMATIYRNLLAFKQSGLIQSIGVVNGQERFDGNTSDHPHFICRGCGAVIDVDACGAMPGEKVNDYISDKYGVTVKGCNIVFYGYCPDCASENKN